MAIRRSLMDVIDRGLDPKIPHSSLDKKGMLILNHAKASPILEKEDVKTEVLVDEVSSDSTLKEEKKEETKIVPVVVQPKPVVKQEIPKKSPDKPVKPV